MQTLIHTSVHIYKWKPYKNISIIYLAEIKTSAMVFKVTLSFFLNNDFTTLLKTYFCVYMYIVLALVYHKGQNCREPILFPPYGPEDST